ncbi:lipopolysaccharide biosynthesis protein [Marmoricola sp. URHB0036]|uniref:lipopolysaccharide biosynthesis protein n=1 Tax=Marmoricola sp. URHB0036 TaxID=1298863 RepID=UPI0018CA38BB|nr:polysaccharide biosynthesis protein [Marmoricola sp. URHB0036]
MAERKQLRGGTTLAVAMGIMNVTTYLYTILAARLLGPRDYGAFAALMGLLLVITVASLALQATAARRIVATPGHVHQIEQLILRVGVQASVGLGVLCLLLSPVINQVVRLDSLGTAALVAFAAAPLTMMGAQAGILQGERRWIALAMIYVGAGVPRLIIGTVLIVWWPNEFAALLGVAIAAYIPVAVGWLALRRPRDPGEHSEEHRVGALWSETLHNSHALLAFFALSNVDILVARNVLDEHQAGLYAGGLILVKAVLFLPQFVVVLAFPSMGVAESRLRTLLQSLVATGLIGAIVALGVTVLSGWAIIFVGGKQYSAISDWLWAFALLGGVLSMLQIVVYSVLARQARKSVYLLWFALVAVIGLGSLADTFDELLRSVLGVDTTVLVILVAISLVRLRHPTAAAGPGSVGGGVPAAPGAHGDVEGDGQRRG